MRTAIARYKHYRQMTEPPQRHTGAIFKDPPGDQASRLIALTNLQGTAHGRARIAENNANYIVNEEGAFASDIAALMVEIHQRVLDQCGVDLEPDCELHGDW